VTAAVLTAGTREVLGQSIRDLMAWLTRRPFTRPGEVAIGHSATLRGTVFLLVGAEVLVEGLMDVSMIPPAWRPFHMLWMALIIDLATVFAAVTKRNPHRLTETTLRIRAGLFDEIVVPLTAIRSVRREMVSAPGRGTRPLPGRPGDVVCTVAGTAEIAVELREPVDLLLGDGSRLSARRLHLAADVPATAQRELTRAIREAGNR
jgi:hypothetical protein